MVHSIRARNVNQAVGEAMQWLKVAGVDEDSRAGPVRVAPGPVATTYTMPTQRILFNADRDANPVFHLMESIWMLAGRQDVAFLLPYNARMREYAEDDGTIHGAYGYRWRNYWQMDQILELIYELREKPNSRQAVLSMWSPGADLRVTARDRPCNTHAYFDLRGGKLNMTVCCRSNDAIWGAYGANVVHFSVLQEVMAHSIGVPVGTYTQFSNNLHVYKNLPLAQQWLDHPPFWEAMDDYPSKTIPLLLPHENIQAFFTDCQTMCRGSVRQSWLTEFFRTVAYPLQQVYLARKAGGRTWRMMLNDVADCDWKDAFISWANRRNEVNGQG